MTYVMIGKHAVAAALENRDRTVEKLWLDKKNRERAFLLGLVNKRKQKPTVVHGSYRLDHRRASYEVAALVHSLPGRTVAELAEGEKKLVVVIAHLTDTGNVGAIIRSAYLMGAKAVIIPKDRNARETSALARAACGALDILPIMKVTNLSRALAQLRQKNFWVTGLDQEGQTSLPDRLSQTNIALVVGSEDRGLPALVKKSCDWLWKLPMPAVAASRNPVAPDSYNAATAAAIAMTLLQSL